MRFLLYLHMGLLMFLIVYHSAEAIYLVPLVSIYFKKIETPLYFKPFITLLTAILVIDLIASYLATHHMHNIWVSNIYHLLEMVLITLTLYFLSPQRLKLMITICGLLASLFYVITWIFVIKHDANNSLGTSVGSAVLLLPMCFLLVWLAEKGLGDFFQDDRFYIIAGFVLLNAFTALDNVLYDNFSMMLQYLCNIFVTWSSNFLFAYAVYCYYKRKRRLSALLN